MGEGGCGRYPLISAPALCCIVNLTVRESGEIWVSLQSVIWNLWAISSVTKTNTWREAVRQSHNSPQNTLALHHSTSYRFTSSLQCVNHVKDNYQNRYRYIGLMISTKRQSHKVIQMEFTVWHGICKILDWYIKSVPSKHDIDCGLWILSCKNTI